MARFGIICGVELPRPPLSTRYGGCAACKAFIAEQDGYYKTVTGEGGRTLLCGECATAWARTLPARGTCDLFAGTELQKDDY